MAINRLSGNVLAATKAAVVGRTRFPPSHHATYIGLPFYDPLLKSPTTSNGPESRDLLNPTGIEPIGALTGPHAPPEDSVALPKRFHARHAPSSPLSLPRQP